ncbi:tripartite tricarboxylate transporter TctB family protein [Anaerospora hongkongensis]|uniref:tripartite tricarboxylate transporter TctB family protein n=1 Tax=Anaerospora hongkongensis TaxID=244830 RepID=UPI00289E494B|nr:tripartite tricarboxylate transporter TctB family protein [Anaerospora hongkongensis]
MIEKIITLLFLLGSSAYLYAAQQLAFGTLSSPKSGFLPHLAGSAAVLLSALLLVRQARSNKAIPCEKADWTKFIFIIIGFIFYIVVLSSIGYLLSTFILLFYLLKVTDTSGWIQPLLIAVISSAACYLVFGRYLAVPLP